MLHVLYEAKPYSTARVNCADEFHTLGRRVIRRVYATFLRARKGRARLPEQDALKAAVLSMRLREKTV